MAGDSQSTIEKPENESLLDDKTIEQMTPAPDAIYLPINDCVTDLIYTEDGSPAPDVEFHYSIKFEMKNLADYNALIEHPQGEEIANTIISYMREHGNYGLSLELERDANEYGAYASDELGPNSLTPGTQGDLQTVLDELMPILKETYGIDMGVATISRSAQEVEGCTPSMWVVPSDLADSGPGIQQENTTGTSDYKPM